MSDWSVEDFERKAREFRTAWDRLEESKRELERLRREQRDRYERELRLSRTSASGPASKLSFPAPSLPTASRIPLVGQVAYKEGTVYTYRMRYIDYGQVGYEWAPM